MTGMDGINSLQKALGALQVNDAASVGGTAQVAGQTARSASSVTTTAGSGVDSARLSAAGELAAGTSDVRMDKVASLQAAIASGTYNVPSSAVADKMVESLLK